MRNFISRRLHLLAGSRGDAPGSIKELVVTAPIRSAIVAAALAAAILVVTLNSTLGNSATASSRLNVGDIEFKQDVRGATLVHAYGDDRIALLTTTGSQCTIKQWFTKTDGGTPSLRSSTTTAAGACTTDTTVPAPATNSALRVDDLQAATIAYENLGGRTITFDTTGNASLAAGSRPADVADADWNDVRPYMIRIDVKSADQQIAKFSRQGVFTGTTAIVNAPAASEVHYVPATNPLPTPSELRITSVVRSQSTGTAYSGAREGVTVTFTGGTCPAMPTTPNLSYAASSPDGIAPVNVVTQRTLTDAASTLELAGVANGSGGAITLTAACGVGSEVKQAVANYHQELPAPALTVKQGSSAEQYALTWTAVSSLTTSYEPSWATSFGTDDQMPETTGLTATKAFTTGTTYGATITFWVTARVGDDSTKSAPAAIATAWPATPAGANMVYTRTGYSGNFVSGQVTWSFTGTCPAGTTIQASQLENRTGQSNGTVSNTVNYQGPFQNNLTKVSWSPSYATQGYLYGMGLQTRCASPNGLYSPVIQVQSNNWITPFATPAQSSWQAFNFRERVRGTGWTYSTCAASNCEKSIQVDWGTACPAGTWVGWSNWYSRSWTGNVFTHPYGYQDNWGLPSGVNSSVVTYYGAQYYCSSPWANSPYSPATGGVNVSVLR